MYSIDMVIYISVQSTSSIKLGLPLRSDQYGGEGVGRNPPLIVKGFFKILVGGGGEVKVFHLHQAFKVMNYQFL